MVCAQGSKGKNTSRALVTPIISSPFFLQNYCCLCPDGGMQRQLWQSYHSSLGLPITCLLILNCFPDRNSSLMYLGHHTELPPWIMPKLGMFSEPCLGTNSCFSYTALIVDSNYLRCSCLSPFLHPLHYGDSKLFFTFPISSQSSYRSTVTISSSNTLASLPQ